MSHIVKDVSPETLFAASYEHFQAYILHCARSTNGPLLDTPELAWGICGADSAWMNSVMRTRLNSEADVDEAVETVLSHAKEWSVPLGWFLAPGTTPTDIADKLEQHGLIYEEDEPGMAVDLQSLPDHVPTPDHFRVVEVLDLPTLETWIETWGESYNAPHAKRQNRFDFRARQGLNADSAYRSFLAYVGDQPVATSELFLGAGVAAVVWVGTIPSARRQGLGAAVTLGPLLEARKLGYRIGALQSSPMGYAVYQQMGFEEYCRMPVYIWSPAR